jgi:CBS domain-containing protein
MIEPVVATVMTCPPVAVTPRAPFKEVVRALLACDACAVPVVDTRRRPVGVITEIDVLANLEFHGGADAAPILSGAAARRRRRKASATSAADLMTAPAALIAAHAPVGRAARRLAELATPHLCVVDHEARLVGTLSGRNLLTLYLRSDDDIETDVLSAIEPDRGRPTRTPADLTVRVRDGIVTLDGTLAYRSRAEHAGYAASRVAGVIAVHNALRYDIDDLAITGF